MSNSDLKIINEQVQRHGKEPITVFHLRGWLDGQSEAGFVGAAEEVHAAGSRYLVLDLEDVDTLTSAGMRAIQKIFALYNSHDGEKSARMKLCSAPPPVYHVLGLTGFLHTMPMYENLKAALDSFEA